MCEHPVRVLTVPGGPLWNWFGHCDTCEVHLQTDEEWYRHHREGHQVWIYEELRKELGLDSKGKSSKVAQPSGEEA